MPGFAVTVLAIGLNHPSAPLDLRARFAFTPERLPAALHSLRERLSRAAPEATLERALKSRRRRPVFMVDLSVPRDIEPEVARLADVYLYTVDDLSALVQTGGKKRQAAVARAEQIVDAGVRGFAQWLEQRASAPACR